MGSLKITTALNNHSITKQFAILILTHDGLVHKLLCHSAHPHGLPCTLCCAVKLVEPQRTTIAVCTVKKEELWRLVVGPSGPDVTCSVTSLLEHEIGS